MRTLPSDKKMKEKMRWMMMTLQQNNHSKTPQLPEPTRRYPKPPIAPHFSPLAHLNPLEHLNSQRALLTGTPPSLLQTPNESGCQISWEQESPHPTHIR